MKRNYLLIFLCTQCMVSYLPQIHCVCMTNTETITEQLYEVMVLIVFVFSIVFVVFFCPVCSCGVLDGEAYLYIHQSIPLYIFCDA